MLVPPLGETTISPFPKPQFSSVIEVDKEVISGKGAAKTELLLGLVHPPVVCVTE